MADELVIPVRPDGTPKTFFYDTEGQHMIYRNPEDGALVAIGLSGCRHEVEQA